MSFDSLAPARLALRANLRLLYLKGPAFSIVVNSAEFWIDETTAHECQRAPIDATRELAREMCFQKCAGVVHGRDDRAPLFCAATRFENWEGSSSSHDPLFSREAAFLFYAKAASPRKWVSGGLRLVAYASESAARCPPADAPQAAIREGSIPYSAAWARSQRTADLQSWSWDGKAASSLSL